MGMLLLPIGHSAVTRRIPWANHLLVAANIGVFIAQVAVQGAGLEPFMLQPKGGKIYQLLSYAFLHADALHLAGNMIFLWVFGNAVNDRLGHLRYLLSYLGFIAMAGLGYLFIDARGPMIGASGAICGVVGMFLVLFAGAEVRLLFSFCFFFNRTFLVGAFWIIGFWIASDVAWMILLGQATPVACSAHGIGYAAGISVAVLLLKLTGIPSSDEDMFHFMFMRRPPSAPPRAVVLSMREVPESAVRPATEPSVLRSLPPFRATPLPTRSGSRSLEL